MTYEQRLRMGEPYNECRNCAQYEFRGLNDGYCPVKQKKWNQYNKICEQVKDKETRATLC